ncbi:MAG: hypothetical protein SVM79_09970 [Chloroflexota bacterium]|nr:hypothetical protein [Chloroflexota bacterium]
MANLDIVRYHVLSSIRAAVMESDGYIEEAQRMRAQGNLRLMLMSEEQLRELARMLSYLPSRPIDTVYNELRQVITEYENTTDQWIGSFGVTPFKVRSEEQV